MAEAIKAYIDAAFAGIAAAVDPLGSAINALPGGKVGKETSDLMDNPLDWLVDKVKDLPAELFKKWMKVILRWCQWSK